MYFVECVSKIKHIFSVIHYTIYGLCVFSLPISLVMIERIYTLSYYHHQIGDMNYYPLFRVRSWNNGMRCMSLYILMTSSNENISALLAICAGNSPVTGEFPAQRPVTRSFDVFFDLCLNKWFSKHWWGWWFETPSRPIWRDCNVSHSDYAYAVRTFQVCLQCFICISFVHFLHDYLRLSSVRMLVNKSLEHTKYINRTTLTCHR